MKKKNLILAGVLILALTGCGRSEEPAPADSADTGAVSASTAATTAEPEPVQEEVVEPEPEVPEELPLDAQATTPAMYKVVTNYINNYYDGDYTKDSDGNSLENKALYKGRYQVLMLSEDSKEEHPALYQTVSDKAAEEIQTDKDTAESATETAKTDLETSVDDETPFYGPYTDEATVSVTRADNRILSVCSNFESYYGGAHGLYGLSATTYDVKTGKELGLGDVITITEDELDPILIEKIKASSDDTDDFWDLEDTLSHYKFSPKQSTSDSDNYEYNYTWYLDYDGIHFYFGPYEIAAYAYGATDITLPYSDMKDKMKAEYIPAESIGYVTAVSLPFYSSVNDDDSSDLHFVYEADEDASDGYYQCHSLTLKEKEKSAKVDIDFEFSSYLLSPISAYRIITKDGHEYIYASVLSYNDYTYLEVFDITGGDIKYVGEDGFHMMYIDSDTETAGELVLTDPDNLYFAKVGDLLGTYTCYGRYEVGSDGMPVFADKDFKVAWGSNDVTSKKDITVTALDADGNELSTETLPAETHLKPVKTDNESYVDCELSDGSLIRLKYTKTDYPIEIDGESVDNLFDGLVYAG